eukprot:5755926-Prymnesium_polylepis.2
MRRVRRIPDADSLTRWHLLAVCHRALVQVHSCVPPSIRKVDDIARVLQAAEWPLTEWLVQHRAPPAFGRVEVWADRARQAARQPPRWYEEPRFASQYLQLPSLEMPVEGQAAARSADEKVLRHAQPRHKRLAQAAVAVELGCVEAVQLARLGPLRGQVAQVHVTSHTAVGAGYVGQVTASLCVARLCPYSGSRKRSQKLCAAGPRPMR